MYECIGIMQMNTSLPHNVNMSHSLCGTLNVLCVQGLSGLQLDTYFSNRSLFLSRLPAALGCLPHLQSLQLEGNPLRSVRRDVIQCGTARLLKFLRENMKDEGNVNTGSGNLTAVKEVKFPDRYCRVKLQMINLHAMRDLMTVLLEFRLLEIVCSLMWQSYRLEVFVFERLF